jgi:GAF domain-containing protein
MKELRQFMPVTVSLLALSDGKQEYLEVLEVESEKPVYLRAGMTLSLRQTLFSPAFQKNQEIHQENIANKLHSREAQWFRDLGIQSCYLAPFQIQGVTAGILFVGSDSDKGFSNSQRIVLRQVSEYLGVAVHNNLLVEQTDEQSRELDALNRLGTLLTSSLFDLDKVFGQLGDLLDQMIKVEAGAIYLREGEMLIVKTAFGSSVHQAKLSNLHGYKGIYRYVMSRGESVLVRDVSQNPHMSSLISDYGATQTRSILCAPIVAGTEVVGAIHLWNKETATFTDHDEKIMKAVAASLATVVESSRLHRLSQSSTTE